MKLTLENLKYLDRQVMTRREMDKYLTDQQRKRVRPLINEAEILRLLQEIRREETKKQEANVLNLYENDLVMG